MSIRQARKEDWKSISSLLDQLEYPGSEHFLEEKISRMIEDPGDGLRIICLRSGDPDQLPLFSGMNQTEITLFKGVGKIQPIGNLLI